MTNIYRLHEKAFSNVQAYAIFKGKKHLANVNLKFPRDGAERLWCYFHIIGLEMVRAYAGGYGYDKRSAAVQAAIQTHPIPELSDNLKDQDWAQKDIKKDIKAVKALKKVAKDMEGQDWAQALRDNGYKVIQVVM